MSLIQMRGETDWDRHYVAYRKCSDTTWYLYDDKKVKKEDPILTDSNYLCLYKKGK